MARTCKSCGGAMNLVEDHRYFHCNYCGGDEQPERSPDGVHLLGESSGRSCPSCRAGLERATVGHLALEHCPRCLGLVVPQRALREIVSVLWADYTGPLGDARVADPVPAPEGSPLVCPGCERSLARQPYLGGGNLFMDLCESCALLWLERGELRRIVLATQAI